MTSERQALGLSWGVATKCGNQLRPESADTDSPLTVPMNVHLCPPRAVGEDWGHMGALWPSRSRLPLLDERA